MARPKQYDREKILDAATDLFRHKGYGGASMNDLVEATRLNRHSMYSEFGHKDGLYFACIDHYAQMVMSEFDWVLQQEPLGLHSIENYFQAIIEFRLSPNFKSCLFINTIIAQEIVTKAALSKVHQLLQTREDAFHRCLLTAEKNGEINKNKDCQTLAKYLMSFLKGIMITEKHNLSRETLEPLVEMVLSTAKN